MSTINKNHQSLQFVSNINFGLHLQPTEDGDIAYLQARQFDEFGRMVGTASAFAPDSTRHTSHLLNDGDVLFAGKGNRNFAWCYHSRIGPAIASSIFFVIRPLKDLLLPDYLTAILNLPQNQQHFRQLGRGTNIASIRKSELGAFMVPVIPKEQQRKVIEINNFYLKDLSLSEQLIHQKSELHKAIVSKIINSTHAKKIKSKRD